MKVKRTEQIWIRDNDNISNVCHLSKNLYNEANYAVRQEFFHNKRWIRYNELNRIMKESENYRQLPAQTSQQILLLLDKSWKSFFKSIKMWKKHSEKFLGKPKLPKYKKKDGEFILIFTNQQCKIENKMLKFPKKINMEVKTRFKEMNLREVRIIPEELGYTVEIVYEKDIEIKQLDQSRMMSIDLGVRNIVTIANTIGLKPICIKGGVVKSINQYYNKNTASLQQIYTAQGIKTGLKQKKLLQKRNRKIHNYFHKLSKFIIDYCKENNLGVIVIGLNDDWKQNVNLSKKNNQNFVQISYSSFINKLKYKSEENGITIIEQNEAHTSKCSFLDNESIEHHEQYLGSRISRGLFRSSNGIIINADLNGANNILKEAFPKAFQKWNADGIEGVELHPISVNLFAQSNDTRLTTLEGGC